MKITDIAPRRHRLSQLYIDGEAAVKVDTETLLRRGIAIGDELDDEELHALLQASAKHRAEEKALYLLEHRAHSKKELENKITRAEFDREAARSAVEHMEELGLLNDEDYARRLANELFTRKKFGARRVKQELRQKGIDGRAHRRGDGRVFHRTFGNRGKHPRHFGAKISHGARRRKSAPPCRSRLAALRLRFRRDLLCLKFRRMTVKRRCFGCRAVLCVARDGQGVQKRPDFRAASVFLRV